MRGLAYASCRDPTLFKVCDQEDEHLCTGPSMRVAASSLLEALENLLNSFFFFFKITSDESCGIVCHNDTHILVNLGHQRIGSHLI